MQNKTIFPSYIHYAIYFITSLLFACFIDISMIDDGLRHLSFAQNQELMQNWGEVFPFSLFASYDPWFMWHKLLSIFIFLFSYENAHIYVNTTSLFLLLVLVDLHLKKSLKRDYKAFFYIFAISIVYLSSYRYLILRPDLLSGLFVLAALLFKNRFIPIFILTIFYAPFYYLFFLYTGSIGLTYLIQKKFKAFLGVFVASVFSLLFHLFYDQKGYINTVINILNDQNLRMGLEVTEGEPLLSILSNLNYFILLPLFLLGSFYLIYKKYSYFKENPLALFLLLTSILWLNQVRYYALFLPLIFIYSFSFILQINQKGVLIGFRKYFVFLKKYLLFASNKKLFYLIALPYTIMLLAYSLSNNSYNEEVEKVKTLFLNKAFNNKTVLMNKLHVDMYKALYYNPKIKFVPSCSIGWFDNTNAKIKDIYIRMQKEDGIKEEELKQLIDYINADIYIHYLANKKQIMSFEKLKEFGIIPKLIYHDKIIFKVNK